jgi:integrase
MPTFKPVISKSDERRDGTYLVKIRMIHNRQIRYIKTPFYVHKSEITKKGVIKDRFLLDKLDERCAELRKKVSDLGFQIEGMSIDALKERLTSKEVFDLNITDFCERVCDDLRRNKREGTAQGYMCAINALKKYLNKDVVLASDVKKQVANAFVRQQLEINKIRSVKTRVALLSSLFNMAIKEYNDNDLGIIRVPYNPFNFVDNLDIKEEKKNAFKNIEQMQKLINHKTMQEYEKDMFIFSFCTFGMNMADIMKLKKTDYNEKENTIRYKRKKTERRCGENSLIEVKLNDVTTRILEKYKNKTKSELLFNLPKTARVLSYRKIAEELDFEYFTFYTARHTMATFARNVCGIDKYVVHEMLNHASDTKMRVTDAYIDRSYTHLWEANEKLMGLFDWSIYLADF